MAYTKTTWVNDAEPAINDINLNKIEQGIFEAHETIEDIIDGTQTVGKAEIALGLDPSVVLPSSPVGTVTMFAGPDASTLVDWAECDGSTRPRVGEYADLFAVIGTYFGSGDGSTTFNIPDMRGQFARGWDHNRGVDGGRVFGSNQSDQIISHSHDTHNLFGYSSSGDIFFPNESGSGHKHGTFESTYPIDASHGSETRPKNIAMLYIIKVK